MTALLWRATEFPALLAATARAARGRRHQPEVARFCMDAEVECIALQRELRARPGDADAWRPNCGRPLPIRDPKPRLITIVPFRDRVAHHALCAELEPLLERSAIAGSYACRKGKGHHAALERARALARGRPWAWKADVARYFASVPRAGIQRLLDRAVPDGALRERLSRVLWAPWPGLPADRGLPIGTLTSQLLANAYLGRLDHAIQDDLGWRGYLRYMDDFVLFGERAALVRVIPRVRAFLKDALDLELNPRSTVLVPTRDGVPFLGWRVLPDRVLLQARVAKRRWRTVKALHTQIASGALGEDHGAHRLRSVFAGVERFDTWHLRRRWMERIARGL